MILLTTLETRYTLFLLLLYLLLAVQAIRGEGLRLSGPARRAAAAVLAATLAASGYQAVRANAAAIDAGPKEVLAVADWFASTFRPPIGGAASPRASRTSPTTWGWSTRRSPWPKPPRRARYALGQGIDYLYFGGSELTTRRSLMRPHRPQPAACGLPDAVLDGPAVGAVPWNDTPAGPATRRRG